MESAPPPPLPRRQYIAIYTLGFFCLSTVYMMAVLTPLWVTSLGFSPFLVGLIVGSRGALSASLSIHGGALMDRLGPRRVVLWVTFLSFITPPLYPFITWAPLMIPLQMVSGLTTSITWIGAYAVIGQLLKDNPVHAGRLTFFSRLGTLSGPPLIGFIIDYLGFTGAYLFMSAWGACLFASALQMPHGTSSAPTTGGLTVRDVLPRWSDYAASFRLLATPTVTLIAATSMLSICSSTIQSAFFLPHLLATGLSATLIGSLVAVAALAAAISTLFTHRVEKHIDPYLLLISTGVIAILAIVIAPQFSSIAIFLILMSLRGIAEGMSQPLFFTLMMDNVDKENRGRAVGLRIALNRSMTGLSPILIGAVMEFVELGVGFLIVGAVLIGTILTIAWATMRSPDFNRKEVR
jgi:MFS family permease